MINKIIRSVCYFSDKPAQEEVKKVVLLKKILEDKGYLVQTTRFCSTLSNYDQMKEVTKDAIDYTSVGAISYDEALGHLPEFLSTRNHAFNIDLAEEEISTIHTDLLYGIVKSNSGKTFDFTYTFNNEHSSPYFPSANFKKNGFAIGLQPTNLATTCSTLDEWFQAMEECWKEINEEFEDDPEFLGIDSSIAPIGGGDGSFVNFVKSLGVTFEQSTTTEIYTRITRFIKENNPKPIGLCGMMLPCLEDDELAAEYALGNFTIERNIFLSLHSGLGIDVYPLGVDENPDRVVEILKLIQALSNKYQKPLSARFVSDGRAEIGEMSNFQNQYLADTTIRPL